MNKWKDTARTKEEITKHYAGGKSANLAANTLLVVEKEVQKNLYLVSDTNPKKSERRTYKLNLDEIIIEDYSDTRDINIQMLLADGWDAQDLLRKE